jgi:AcrR family transcriptional regulator
MRADAAERRSRLLEAGRDLFAERGYDVPLEAIADKAEVGIATLYRNFPTRHDLKIAILREGLERSRAVFNDVLEQVERDPESALRRIAQTFVSLRLGALIAIVVRDYDEIPPDLIATRKENLAVVAETIARAKAKGYVRQDITPQDFFSGIALITRPQPALVNDPMMTGNATTETLTQRVLAIFLAGLRPSSGVSG